MKREQGFCVHGVMTSTLLEIRPDARAAILGLAFALTFGAEDYALPKKFEVYLPIAKGIAAEAKRLIVEAESKPAPKSGAERTAAYKARKKALAGSAEVTKVTQSDVGDEGDARMNERMNERMNGRTSSPPPSRSDGRPIYAPTADEVFFAGKKLGMGEDAVAEFVRGMEELDWKARGKDGRMFNVTPVNLASVMRGWRDCEKKFPARAGGAADLPPGYEGAAVGTELPSPCMSIADMDAAEEVR